jgi:hypothetical protein
LISADRYAISARVRLPVWGSVSRSFAIAVGIAIVGVAGYVTWTYLRPDPYTVSERIARDARRGVAAEVREFQRDVDTLMHESPQTKKNIPAEIDKHLAAALQGIDDVIAEARDRLGDLDIAVRTQRNRMDRIDGRADEAREMVKELAEDAKQKAAGAAAPPQP